MKPDRALEVLLSRGFGVAYGVAMCLAFAAVGLFVYNEGSAQLVWIFGSGVHAGIAFMWLIAPRVTEKWRREVREELEKIADECLQEIRRRLYAEFPSPTIVPFNEHGRTLQ